MFETKTTNKRIYPKFYVGWNKAKIEAIELKKAEKSDRVQLIFSIFGEPVTQEGFKPFKKKDGSLYDCQVGKVVTSYFMPTSPEEVDKIIKRVINPIAISYKVKDELDKKTDISNPDAPKNITEFVKILNDLFVNENLPFIWMNLDGEEYEKPGSAYPGYSLRFKHITSDDSFKEKTPAGAMKPLNKEEGNTAAPQQTNDLPF